MSDLSTLDVGRKEVDGLAERLAHGSGGSEHLGVAAHAKDADVEVLVGVLVEVLLDLVRDLSDQLTVALSLRPRTTPCGSETYHLLVSGELGLLLSQQLLRHLFELSLELRLFDQADARLAELLQVLASQQMIEYLGQHTSKNGFMAASFSLPCSPAMRSNLRSNSTA